MFQPDGLGCHGELSGLDLGYWMLSVLGIIIGTSAVITLMAFGEGSMRDALEDINDVLHEVRDALNVPQADTLRLADQMASAWVSFATTGNPNNPKTPNWPAYDLTKRTTMVWDSESKAMDDPRGQFREFWANRAPGVGER